MTDTTILIATFPPRLGIEKASFLATLLLYALPDYLIILDGGQHLGPKAVTEKTNIIFCHEYLAQLTPSMRETMIGSAETLTAFRLGPTDSDRLKKEFDLYDNDRQLTELWPYHYHEKTVAVKKNEYLRPPDFSFHAPQKLINHSREKFAVPGKHVEKSIERFTDSI